MVDKNLFLHDLAVVAILKFEGPYLKEWLDYHLLAGVNHFYLYDNESPDNQAEVAKPYVEAGLVDYFPAPGKIMQAGAYNDAVKNFKFQCQHMAFIDGDEFIYPKMSREGGVSEVVSEILSHYPNASGLAINWQMFGSNGQEKADYSKGVLERFTRRAPKDWTPPDGEKNSVIKTVSNPRRINFFSNAHYPVYFEGCCSVNENGEIISHWYNDPVLADTIVINHYHTKSREEYEQKIAHGRTDILQKRRNEFDHSDRNEEFDDGILRYRAERAKTYRQPDMAQANERLLTR